MRSPDLNVTSRNLDPRIFSRLVEDYKTRQSGVTLSLVGSILCHPLPFNVERGTWTSLDAILRSKCDLFTYAINLITQGGLADRWFRYGTRF